MENVLIHSGNVIEACARLALTGMEETWRSEYCDTHLLIQ